MRHVPSPWAFTGEATVAVDVDVCHPAGRGQKEEGKMKDHYPPSLERVFELEQENAALKRSIELHKEYEQLLVDELNSLVGISTVHGWVSTRVERGKQLREEIAKLEK